MSALATAWAWRQTQLSSTTKLILLAYADPTNDQGYVALTFERLAELTSLSETTLRKSVADLVKAGLLERAVCDMVHRNPVTLQNYLVPQYRLVITEVRPA